MRLFRDDSAQATTEYVLLLAIAIGIFLMVYARLLKPFLKKFSNRLSDYFDRTFMKGDLHQFPIHR